MSSRKQIIQTVSNTEPIGAALGDEWFQPTSNKLFKRIIYNGVVGWTEIPLTVNSTTSVSFAGGEANQILYQISSNQTGFITAPAIAGSFLSWNGTTFLWNDTISNANNAVNSTNASNVATTATSANSAYFLTFVDTNNSSTSFESLFTTSSFTVNPNSGNVGIGTSSATSKLTVVGDARISGITTVTNNTNASSTVTGALQVEGGVGIRRDVYVGGNLNLAGSLVYGNTTLTPIKIQEFTSTNNQTTFTVTNGYTVGTTQVFANGVALGLSDFTATNGSTVVLGLGRNAGDIIRVVSGGAVASVNLKILTTSTDTLISTENEVIFASAPLTLTLPDATFNLGFSCKIKNLSNGQINIVPQNGQTIDGNFEGLTMSYKNSSLSVVSDGVNWNIF